MNKQPPSRFVVCIDNTGYPASLELHKIYRVLSDKEDDDLRVIDESGEDYLYPSSMFVFIDVPQPVEQAIMSSI